MTRQLVHRSCREHDRANANLSDDAVFDVVPARRVPYAVRNGFRAWRVTADLTLDEGAYKIPFRVLFVFDKTYAGTWSLVHAHFAVPAPT